MVNYDELQVGDQIIVLPYSAYKDLIDTYDRGREGEIFTVRRKIYNPMRGMDAIEVEEDAGFYWYPAMFEMPQGDDLIAPGDDDLLAFLKQESPIS